MVDGWITTLSMHSDENSVIYDYEWPKNAADLTRLFQQKSLELQEIQTFYEELDGEGFTTGIKFMFYDEKEPITYG